MLISEVFYKIVILSLCLMLSGCYQKKVDFPRGQTLKLQLEDNEILKQHHIKEIENFLHKSRIYDCNFRVIIINPEYINQKIIRNHARRIKKVFKKYDISSERFSIVYNTGPKSDIILIMSFLDKL